MAVYPTYPSLIGCWFSLAGEVYLAKDQGMRWITDSATCTSVRLDWNSIEALDRSDTNSQMLETCKQTPQGPELAKGTVLAIDPHSPDVYPLLCSTTLMFGHSWKYLLPGVGYVREAMGSLPSVATGEAARPWAI